MGIILDADWERAILIQYLPKNICLPVSELHDIQFRSLISFSNNIKFFQYVNLIAEKNW